VEHHSIRGEFRGPFLLHHVATLAATDGFSPPFITPVFKPVIFRFCDPCTFADQFLERSPKPCHSQPCECARDSSILSDVSKPQMPARVFASVLRILSAGSILAVFDLSIIRSIDRLPALVSYRHGSPTVRLTVKATVSLTVKLTVR
jgi:hypothetical protein